MIIGLSAVSVLSENLVCTFLRFRNKVEEDIPKTEVTEKHWML